MEALRSKLLENDVDNIKKLGDVLNGMDRDKDNVLSLQELIDGIKSLGLDMPDDEVKQVFTDLDKDNSLTLDLQEFFVAVRGCMSEAKLDIVMKAFQKLDKDGSGKIDMDDLKDGYDFKAARSGRNVMTNEQAAHRFIMMFDTDGDKKITKEEFLNYYAGRSRMTDEKFIKAVRDTWNLTA